MANTCNNLVQLVPFDFLRCRPVAGKFIFRAIFFWALSITGFTGNYPLPLASLIGNVEFIVCSRIRVFGEWLSCFLYIAMTGIAVKGFIVWSNCRHSCLAWVCGVVRVLKAVPLFGGYWFGRCSFVALLLKPFPSNKISWTLVSFCDRVWWSGKVLLRTC